MTLFPRIGLFKILSKDDLYKVHEATLELLEEVGVLVRCEEALMLLEEAGADVDQSGQRVKIPSYLVEECTRKAPRAVLFVGRNPSTDLRLGWKKVHFGTGAGATQRLYPVRGGIKKTTKKDVGEAVRLVDALPNVDFVMSLFCSLDVPKQVMPLHDLDAMLRNTTKPLMVVDFGVDANYLIDMVAAIVGGREELKERPLLGMYSEPISPLTHGKMHIKNLMSFAKARLPLVYIPSPMMGATSPMTLAGTLVQSNAETLSGNVIAQLTLSGAPFIYGADATVMDMKYGVFSYGAPEWMILNLALAQLGRFYRLPIWSTGGCTDSKILDGQAFFEAALTLFVAAASGANLVHDFGFMDFGLTGSLELVTACDEYVSMFRRILRGIKVDDDTIGLDVMKEVGPGGNFLNQPHTRKHFEWEYWMPDLIDRRTRRMWEKAGAKSLVERLSEKTNMLLNTHRVEALDRDIQAGLNSILKRAEKELIGT